MMNKGRIDNEKMPSVEWLLSNNNYVEDFDLRNNSEG